MTNAHYIRQILTSEPGKAPHFKARLSEAETIEYLDQGRSFLISRETLESILKDLEQLKADANATGQTDDPVNSPAHYTIGGIEVIDAIEAWQLNFHLANVVKYVARSAHKGKELEDLKKARWYLDRQIKQLEP